MPEDRYGTIQIGQPAQVTVDSFPGRTFSGTVQRIADRGEYTPRNVQTPAGRRSVVYAVKVAVENPGGELKPGMPADVTFGYASESRRRWHSWKRPACASISAPWPLLTASR